MSLPRLTRSALACATLTTLLASCAQFNPALREDRAYVRALMPLLQDNALLSERVLVEAAAIYNEKSEPEKLGDTWAAEIVPLAEHLHNQSAFVQAPETWTEHHGELVDIWGDRARAYRTLADAIATADDEQWRTARDLADGVKLAEEKWFQSANERLTPNGLAVDQFP